MAEREPLETVGPFVAVAAGIWVNALHVAAIVPIDSIKTTELQCRVYVAGPSLGGGHVLAWNSQVTSVVMVETLALALDAHARQQGYQEEKGRGEALDESDVDD